MENGCSTVRDHRTTGMSAFPVSKRQSQRTPSFQLAVSVGVVAFSFVCLVSVGSAREHFNVYADAMVRVSLESDPNVSSDSSTNHDHPLDLDLGEVIVLLKGLEAERDPGFLKSLVNGKKRLAVFGDEEITVLAPQIQKAFAQVLPPERVSFLVSSPEGSEEKTDTSGSMWVQGNQIHITLNRYHSLNKSQQSAIPGPYDSSFSRSPSGAHANLPDFTVHFSPVKAVIEQTPTAIAQMFASPETQIAIDRGQLAKLAADDVSEVYASSSSQNKRDIDSFSSTCVKQFTDMETQIERLTDRVKSQEAQISDLLGIVKKLTNSP